MSTFEKRAIYIFDKRWYSILISKPEDKKRARALIDDFNLNVICYTPETLPGYD